MMNLTPIEHAETIRRGILERMQAENPEANADALKGDAFLEFAATYVEESHAEIIATMARDGLSSEQIDREVELFKAQGMW